MSDTLTDTTYAQVYPYTGLPEDVKKYQLYNFDPSNKHQISETVTTYCDSTVFRPFDCGEFIPPGNLPIGPVFVFPQSIIDTAYLHPEAIDTTGTADTTDAIVTDSEFVYDNFGNATATTTTTSKKEHCAFDTTQPCVTEQFSKTVANLFTTAAEEQQGKPYSTTVTGTGGTMATKHYTTFEYATADTFGGSPSYLVLTKTHLEPGSGFPFQLDTAYAYDQFGNRTTTTSCANDFAGCQPGATAPSQSLSDPLHHPPFRTTSTSYDPSVIGVPVSYGRGRFPVTTTDPAGHVQTSLYDPILGEVLTKTDPNRIQTCFSYDAFGRQTSETDRCGSSAPLTTTTEHFVAVPQPSDQCAVSIENCTARVVTQSTPPDGNPIWTFTDDQGHPVETFTGAFDGSLIETRTLYDSLGQASQQSKPFPSIGQPEFTVTVRDNFNRVSTVTDPLGVIAGSGEKSTTITTTYNGSAIQSVRTVNGQPQTETEVKNAVGKATSESKVTETGVATISYSYDADGNVTATTDPAGNSVSIAYDVRGRKQAQTDPDMGSWQYCTDGFGDLYGQIDAKNSSSTCTSATPPVSMTYDPLGRVLTKTDATGTGQWVYDVAPGAGIGKVAAMVSAPDAKLAGPCAIPLVAATDGNRAGKSFTYDQFGDVQQVTECADGQNFVSSYTYDSLGRQNQIRYPVVKQSQLAVGYHYTSSGYLQYLTDDSSDYGVLWQAKAVNALGQVTDEQMRNGVETASTRDPLTGWLLSSTATAHANNNSLLQTWSYSFDEIGNLRTRTRADAANVTSQETFWYDLTNRLTSANVQTNGNVRTSSYTYDSAGLGNLMQKDSNAYTYGASGGCAAGPHAVCSVGGGTQYTYDANGNMLSNGSRTVTYNPSNKVTEVVSDPMPSQGNDTGTVDLMYGADANRVVQSVASNGTTTRTVYVGLGATGKSLYEQITKQTAATTTVGHANYIYAGGVHGGNAFALRVLADDGSVSETRYYSFDHLGSVTAMSDEEGRVAGTEQDATLLAYDAWGARRNPDESAAVPTSFALPTGNREFTGQEQIPDVGLVNMNGRMYDPSLGRFLSPDPSIQDVSDLQSYNRYSYALNNPLRYTDPTGFFWSQVWGGVKSEVENPIFWYQVAFTTLGCVGGGPAVCLVAGMEIAAFNAGVTLASGLSSGNFGQSLLVAGIGLGVGIVSGKLPGLSPLIALGNRLGLRGSGAGFGLSHREG